MAAGSHDIETGVMAEISGTRNADLGFCVRAAGLGFRVHVARLGCSASACARTLSTWRWRQRLSPPPQEVRGGWNAALVPALCRHTVYPHTVAPPRGLLAKTASVAWPQ